MVEFIIHPGFVKTGTTFFQENIIPNIKNTESIGKPYKDSNTIQNKIKKIIHSKKNFSIQKISKISKEILNKINKKKLKRIILSDEAFLDSEFYNPKNNFNNLEKLILQISKKKEINVKFLITTRNQPNVIISRFAYLYPKFKKKYLSLDNYININIKKKSYFFNSLKYFDLYKYLKKRFKCKVIFLPVELLKNNKKKYIKILKNLFGKDILYSKIKFSKKNVNSENLNFYLKKGNLWHDYYTFLHSLKKNFPVGYLNILPFKSKIKKFLYNKIKYKKTKNSIMHSDKSYKKIYNYYKFSNQKLYKKNKINYL